MDENQRRIIQGEIATLEGDLRRVEYDLRSKEGLLSGYPADKAAGLENEIRGLRSQKSGLESKIREFKSRL